MAKATTHKSSLFFHKLFSPDIWDWKNRGVTRVCVVTQDCLWVTALVVSAGNPSAVT